MATIEETATEVADKVILALGDYDQFPDLRKSLFVAAKNAAILMSQRLDKSIDADDFFERTIEFQTRSISMAQGHIQVIVLAGYAAFFTLWTSMASQIPVLVMICSGAFMAISLIIFVAWTIAGAIQIKVITERTAQTYRAGPVDLLTRLVATEAENYGDRDKLMRWWRVILWTAGPTALAAALLLSAFAFASTVSKALRMASEPTAHSITQCARQTLGF